MQKRIIGLAAVAIPLTFLFSQNNNDERVELNPEILTKPAVQQSPQSSTPQQNEDIPELQSEPSDLTEEQEQDILDHWKKRAEELDAIYMDIHDMLHEDLDNETKADAIINIIFMNDEDWLHQLNTYGQSYNIDRAFIDAIESIKDDLQHLDTSTLSYITTMLSQRNELFSITAMDAKRNAITSGTYDDLINDFIASNEAGAPAYLERIETQSEASLKYNDPPFPDMDTGDNVKALIIDRIVNDSFDMRDYPAFLEAKIIAEDTNDIQSSVWEELDKRTDRQPNRVMQSMLESTMGISEIN